MKWLVTMACFDLTREGNPMTLGQEVIDPKGNELFSESFGPWEVEDQVENFWNRLSDEDNRGPYFCHTPSEKIKVVRVERVADSRATGRVQP